MEPAGAKRHRRASARALTSGDASQSISFPSSSGAIYKVAVAYAIVGWLSIQIATQVFPFLEIPNWVVRLVIAAVAIAACATMPDTRT